MNVSLLARRGCKSVFAVPDTLVRMKGPNYLEKVSQQDAEFLVKCTTTWGMGDYAMEIINEFDKRKREVRKQITYPTLAACVYGSSDTDVINFHDRIINTETVTRNQQTHISNCMLLYLTRKTHTNQDDAQIYLSSMIALGAAPTPITFKLLLYLARSNEELVKDILKESSKSNISFTPSDVHNISIASSSSLSDAWKVVNTMKANHQNPTPDTIAGLFKHCKTVSDVTKIISYASSARVKLWPSMQSLETISGCIMLECVQKDVETAFALSCCSLLDQLINNYEREFKNYPIPMIVLGNQLEIYKNIIKEELLSLQSTVSNLGFSTSLPHGMVSPRPFITTPLLCMSPYGQPVVFPEELSFLTKLPEHQGDVFGSQKSSSSKIVSDLQRSAKSKMTSKNNRRKPIRKT